MKACKKFSYRSNGVKIYEIVLEHEGRTVSRELRPAVGESAANRRVRNLQADVERGAFDHLKTVEMK